MPDRARATAVLPAILPPPTARTRRAWPTSCAFRRRPRDGSGPSPFRTMTEARPRRPLRTVRARTATSRSTATPIPRRRPLRARARAGLLGTSAPRPSSRSLPTTSAKTAAGPRETPDARRPARAAVAPAAANRPVYLRNRCPRTPGRAPPRSRRRELRPLGNGRGRRGVARPHTPPGRQAVLRSRSVRPVRPRPSRRRFVWGAAPIRPARVTRAQPAIRPSTSITRTPTTPGPARRAAARADRPPA